MIKVKCPICDTEIEFKEGTKNGTRYSCPTCFAQLSLRKVGGQYKAACALCKKVNMDCKTCDERERTRVEKDLIS